MEKDTASLCGGPAKNANPGISQNLWSYMGLQPLRGWELWQRSSQSGAWMESKAIFFPHTHATCTSHTHAQAHHICTHTPTPPTHSQPAASGELEINTRENRYMNQKWGWVMGNQPRRELAWGLSPGPDKGLSCGSTPRDLASPSYKPRRQFWVGVCKL